MKNTKAKHEAHEPAAQNEGAAPGKRAGAHGQLSADGRADKQRDIARAELATAGRELARLRGAIAARDFAVACAARHRLEYALQVAERELPREERDELQALRAEATPVLALAPPRAAHVASPLIAHEGVADRSEERAWLGRLEGAAPRGLRDATTLQLRATGYPADDIDLPRTAATGVAAAAAPLPHLDAIQASFGAHDVTGVASHTAPDACGAIGAEAYATGDHVAFATSAPSLFVAAHEAAHVVQQRAGVQLLGGVGQVGDPYEQHADAVADKVVRGESAEEMLGTVRQSGGSAVQRKAATALASGGLQIDPSSMTVSIGDAHSLAVRADRVASAPTVDAAVPQPIVAVGNTKTQRDHDAATWSAEVVGRAPGVVPVKVSLHDGASVEDVTCLATVPQPTMKLGAVTRIHEPNGMSDPVASTLYPGDSLRAELSIDAGPRAALVAKLHDPAGVIADASAIVTPGSTVVRARAMQVGTAKPAVSVQSLDGLPVAALPLSTITVEAALAGEQDNALDAPDRVKTTNIDDAKDLLIAELEYLLEHQKRGVTAAKEALLTHKHAEPIPWYAALMQVAIEACISYVSAGIGTGIGKDLLTRVGSEGGAGLFDVQAAVTGSLKDAIKSVAKQYVLDHDKDAKDSVDLPWAVDLFCEAQASGLADAAIHEKTRWINAFQSYRDLEAKQPGAGLAAVEARRHAIAKQSAVVADAQQFETVRQWLLYLAQSTHGKTEVFRGPDEPPALDPDGTPTKGTDLGRDGRGTIDLSVDIDESNPASPVRVTGFAINGLGDSAARDFAAHERTLANLGLPFTVSYGRGFVIGRNEAGDIWTQIISGAMGMDYGWASDTKKYLFAKGTGRTSWQDDDELEHGVQQGVKMVIYEVLPFKIDSIPYRDHSEWPQ